jgi:steroid delta-isomerase
VWGDVAVVRLIWTLTIRPKGGAEITAIEPGLDVFRRERDGRWRIIRYMAYEQ